MNLLMPRLSLIVLLLALVSTTRGKAEDQHFTNQSSHAVFVMTNAADKNEVISFRRAFDGTLRQHERFATGGRGSGGNTDPLGSQGSLTLSQDKSLLFAANVGSGEISVFRVLSTLSLTDVVPAGGSEPDAIAQHGNLVYVLNAGGSSNVFGFRLLFDRLRPIRNSVRFLSTNTSGASSLVFSPDGRFLVVTELLTNNIDVFHVKEDGTLSPAVINSGVGPGTFSLVFAPNGAALVTETGAGGVPNVSAVSSYAVLPQGTLKAITSSLPTPGDADCWNAVTPDGRFVYNSSAGSASIAGFAIHHDGSLTALPGTIVGNNPTGATNLDIAISSDGKFLYTLNSGNGTIGSFAIQRDGSLVDVGSTSGLPSSGV